MSENPTLESALLRVEARLDRLLADVEKVRERIITAITEVQAVISRAEHQRWQTKQQNAEKAPAEAGADGGELA
jgi:hypothetical protein